MDNIYNGVVIINKAKGYTSHDVVAIAKKVFKSKAGHTGTLDPEAEGVLPVLLGQATKLSDILMASSKEYIAEVCLGKTTTTQDATGEVLCEKEVEDFSEEQIITVLKSFEGNISQIPPMYSALKVGGKKLYELAREGKEIERTPREITIDNIFLTQIISKTSFTITVACSKGTYIRSLAADIGQKLGCGGHMGSLCRVRTGNFTLKDAITIDRLRELANEGTVESVICSMEDVLSFPKIIVKESSSKFLYNGNKLYENNLENKLDDNLIEGQLTMVYDYKSELVGLYRYKLDAEKKQFYLKVDKFLKG